MIKQRIVDLIRKVTYGSGSKRVEIDKDDLPVYKCKREDVTYFSSSNNIIRAVVDETTIYFKECRIHSKFQIYIEDVITDYFENINSFEKKEEIELQIKNELSNLKNIRKLKKMNAYVESHYETTRKRYSGWDLGKVGFPGLFQDYSKGKEKVVEFLENFGTEFVLFIRNEIYSFKLNNFIKQGHYQIFRPMMSVATKKLADLFELDDMFPNCWFAVLCYDGIERVGIVTKECNGICPTDMSLEEKQHISPIFQKELNRLNYFDAICFQRDHKQNNYFVDFNADNEICRVIALDNDSPMTFFPMPILSFPIGVHSSSICHGMKPNRPYVDRCFFDIIKQTTPNRVFHWLESELPFAQRLCMTIRFCWLKSVISKVQVLNDVEWSNNTIQVEISGKYGQTYLKHYLECDENQLIEEIMGGK